MAREVFVLTGSINDEKLVAEGKAASVRFGGFVTRPRHPGGIFLIFEDSATEADIAAVQAVVLAHNPSATPAQQARAQATADFAEMVQTQAAAKLTQLDNAISAVDSDIAIIGGTPTNAQIVAVIGRMLTRERADYQLAKQLIKAFAHLAQLG